VGQPLDLPNYFLEHARTLVVITPHYRFALFVVRRAAVDAAA
jgi:hypothetical protein